MVCRNLDISDHGDILVLDRAIDRLFGNPNSDDSNSLSCPSHYCLIK